MAKEHKLKPWQRQEVKAAFVKYIEGTEDPNIAGFVSYDPVAIKYGVTRRDMYDSKYFDPLTKRAITKQEAYLLKVGMASQNVTMAIFRLKQPYHGYRDRFEQDITTAGEKITFTNAVPRPGKVDPKVKGK